jgi:hypothetical protein
MTRAVGLVEEDAHPSVLVSDADGPCKMIMLNPVLNGWESILWYCMMI